MVCTTMQVSELFGADYASSPSPSAAASPQIDPQLMQTYTSTVKPVRVTSTTSTTSVTSPLHPPTVVSKTNLQANKESISSIGESKSPLNSPPGQTGIGHKSDLSTSVSGTALNSTVDTFVFAQPSKFPSRDPLI